MLLLLDRNFAASMNLLELVRWNTQTQHYKSLIYQVYPNPKLTDNDIIKIKLYNNDTEKIKPAAVPRDGPPPASCGA